MSAWTSLISSWLLLQTEMNPLLWLLSLEFRVETDAKRRVCVFGFSSEGLSRK